MDLASLRIVKYIQHDIDCWAVLDRWHAPVYLGPTRRDCRQWIEDQRLMEDYWTEFLCYLLPPKDDLNEAEPCTAA